MFSVDFTDWTSTFNVHSAHGSVVNPHQVSSSDVPWTEREKRSAGGSSGGSAAAVAAGMCDAYVTCKSFCSSNIFIDLERCQPIREARLVYLLLIAELLA